MGKIGVYFNPYASDEWSRERHPFLYLFAESLQAEGWSIIGVESEEMCRPRSLATRQFDLMHIHFPPPVYSPFTSRPYRIPIVRGILAWRAIRQMEQWADAIEAIGIPIVWQIHDLFSHHAIDVESLRKVDEQLRRRIYGLAKGVIVHENACMPPVIEHFGEKALYAVTPLGDYTLIHGHPVPKDTARRHLGIQQNGRVLAYVGTARRNRNPSATVQQFLQLAGPDDVLILAGQAIGRFVPKRDDARIYLYDGSQPNEHMRDIFCAADFVINDGREYLTSAIIRAAISYGVPVIAYPFGSALDTADGAAFYISSDSDGLRTALNKALRCDAATYTQMQANALKRNAERRWDAYGPSCTALYRTILSQKR